MKHLTGRLAELNRKYKDHWPKWNNEDYIAVGQLLIAYKMAYEALETIATRGGDTLDYATIGNVARHALNQMDDSE